MFLFSKSEALSTNLLVLLASEGQYTLAYGIFSNPTDTKTLTPFLDQIEEQYFPLPEHIVADAGYSSEQNYDDILTKRKRTPLIIYGHYLNEQKKKFKKDPFKTMKKVKSHRRFHFFQL
ncbi:transposase [Neobacillus mesonae]|uniref:transposase n=1 Tax=Neobacillus mesonae TaxID=1193713 RepID=UPI00399D1C4A